MPENSKPPGTDRDKQLDIIDLPLGDRMAVAKKELEEKLKAGKQSGVSSGSKTEFVPPTFAARTAEAMEEKHDNRESRGSLPGYTSGESE